MSAPARLRHTLTFRNMLTLSFGAIVGVGWIPMTGSWLATAGSVGAVVAFLLGAGAMVLVSLCYAESATTFPASGGDVVYAHEAFGPAAAFATGWLLLLIYVSVNAFMAVSAIWIVSVLAPGSGCGPARMAFGMDVNPCNMLVAHGGMLAFTIINILGARAVAAAQDGMTIVFVAAAVPYVFGGIGTGNIQNLIPAFAGANAGNAVSGIAAVLITTPLWYAGFNVVPQAMGERAKDLPVKETARAMVLGIAGAMLFYVLVILAAAMILPRDVLLAADLPAASAIDASLHSPVLGKVVLWAMLGGLLTSWNAALFAGARALLSLGRARLMPPAFATVGVRFASPYVGLLSIAAASMLMALPGRARIDLLANTAGIGFVALYAFACVTALRLRFTLPNASRPYLAPCGPWVPVVACVSSGIMLAIAVWTTRTADDGVVSGEWLILAGWSVLGILAWLAMRRQRESVGAETRRQRLLEDT